MKRATAIAQQFIDALGVKPGDIDTLRALSTDSDHRGRDRARDHVGGSHASPFQPVVDGSVLPRPPLDTIEAGNAAACTC